MVLNQIKRDGNRKTLHVICSCNIEATIMTSTPQGKYFNRQI